MWRYLLLTLLFLVSSSAKKSAGTSRLGVGYFALTTGDHHLQLHNHHQQLLESGKLEFNVLHIGKKETRAKGARKNHYTIQTNAQYKALPTDRSMYKIYEFTKGDKDTFQELLHGMDGALSSHVLFFEKNSLVKTQRDAKGAMSRLNMQRKDLSPHAKPWMNTRWRARWEQLILDNTPCRFALGAGNVGFQQGSFSWAIDILDTRDAAQDLSYCPIGGLDGTGVHVFIMDTGIGTQTTMNYNRTVCDYDYYYDPATYGDRPPCSDAEGHGSHTAGLIASNIYGAAPGVHLHIYKILNDQGFGSFSGLAAGLTDIYSKSIDNIVISMSLGAYGESSSAVSTIVGSLMSDRNAIVVAAAGNDGEVASGNFPSNIPGVVSVGAVDVNLVKPGFSNFGADVDIFAGGVDVISCGLTGTSALLMSGTSMATPIVAAVSALYVQHAPGTSNTELIAAMIGDATNNLISAAGAGSPNKFEYIGSFTADTNPPPPPSTSDMPELVPMLWLLLLCFILLE